MKIRFLLASGILLSTASAVSAQTVSGTESTVPAPSAQPLGGPVVPGMCLLSREAIFANAAVGKVASVRLTELKNAAQADVDAKRAPIDQAAEALAGQPDNEENRAKARDIAEQLRNLRSDANHLSREIDATRVKAMNRIATQAQPIIADVYKQHDCGLLLDRGTVMGGNFTNDLTADVVEALDAKVRTIDFAREQLPRQSADEG